MQRHSLGTLVSNVKTAQHYTYMQVCPLGSPLEGWLLLGHPVAAESCCRRVPCLVLSCKPGMGLRTLDISFLKDHHHYKCVNGYKLCLDKNLKKEWTFSPLGGLKDTLKIKESPHQKLYRATSHPR